MSIFAAGARSYGLSLLPTDARASPRKSTATNSCRPPPRLREIPAPAKTGFLVNSKPRVLLLSASSGAGHVRAAQALEKAFSSRGDCAVAHVDVIQQVSRVFQRVYDKAYISMVRRAAELMRVLYDRTDRPWANMRPRL